MRATARKALAYVITAWTRRRPGERGTKRLQHIASRRLPRQGTQVANFGRGRRIICDLAVRYDRSVYVGREETIERRVLQRMLGSGDVFVDCGANIGLFTIFGGHLVGRSGTVYAVEPVPSTFDRLSTSVALSRMTDRVRLVNNALSDHVGSTVTLSGVEHNVMQIDSQSDLEGVRVTTTTLDALLAPEPDLAGLKIDVEGYEHRVLLGAAATLERHSPWIIVELNSDIAGVRRLDEWNVHSLLSDCGYRAWLPKSLLAGDEALQDGWENSKGYVNLVYLPPRSEHRGRSRQGS